MENFLQLTSPDTHSIISIENGELISYNIHGIEIMHQKGDPGWGKTEIEMFPIIGPTKESNFKVKTPKGDAFLDQHGLARVMEYNLIFSNTTRAVYSKKYQANTSLINHKFPDKSPQEFLNWPYDFELTKSFELTSSGLKICFEIKSEKDMPFMLGFHPAFKIYNKEFIIKTSDTRNGIREIFEAGASALLLKGSKEVLLENNGNVSVLLSTQGFNDIMLWSEVINMVCIEPITFYPYSVPPKKIYKGFDRSRGIENFQVIISPKLE